MRILGILLIVLGAAGLIHRGFTVTTDEEKLAVGPVSVSVEKKERVAVPVWAGVTVLAVGVALILFGGARPKSS